MHRLHQVSHNYYEILPAAKTEDGFPACFFRNAGDDDGVEVEDYHSCEKLNRVACKEFSGICVGTTTLCTRLNAEYEEHPYKGEFFRAYSDTPEQFAVVYYADNKKRIVPLDRIRLL